MNPTWAFAGQEKHGEDQVGAEWACTCPGETSFKSRDDPIHQRLVVQLSTWQLLQGGLHLAFYPKQPLDMGDHTSASVQANGHLNGHATQGEHTFRSQTSDGHVVSFQVLFLALQGWTFCEFWNHSSSAYLFSDLLQILIRYEWYIWMRLSQLSFVLDKTCFDVILKARTDCFLNTDFGLGQAGLHLGIK